MSAREHPEGTVQCSAQARVHRGAGVTTCMEGARNELIGSQTDIR